MNASDKVNFRGKFRQYDVDGNPYLYRIGDTVEYNGEKYVAIKPTSSKIPGTMEGNIYWRSLGGDSAYYIQERTPVNVNIGDRWYKPTDGAEYTFIKEDNNSFWVET